jgi:hypothetical protein
MQGPASNALRVEAWADKPAADAKWFVLDLNGPK